MLEQAHKQLDGVAKDRNGRDSLALGVLKPGGLAFEWVSAWEGMVDDASCLPPHAMQRLARKLQTKRELTTGFLYNIRDRYQPLFEGDKPIGAKRDQMRKFLLAEHLRAGGGGKGGTRADADSRIADLMQIGYPLERKTTDAPQPAERFSFDAGPLMRFLAEEGRWFMAGAEGETP